MYLLLSVYFKKDSTRDPGGTGLASYSFPSLPYAGMSSKCALLAQGSPGALTVPMWPGQTYPVLLCDS